MSRKTVSAVIGSFLVAGFALAAVQGCGSSGGSSGNETAICEQLCVKEEMCLADASTATATSACMTICTSSGTGGNSGTTCTNASAIASASSNCASMSDCTAFETCVQGIPKCTGGTSGAAGGSGTAGCAVCDKAQSCCVAALTLAGQSTASCTYSAASCNAAGTAQASDISICQQILTAGAALPACQ